MCFHGTLRPFENIPGCYKHTCGFLVLLLPLLLYIIVNFLYSFSFSSHLIFLTPVICIKCTLFVLFWCMYYVPFCVLSKEI